MRIGVYVDGYNLYYGGRSQPTTGRSWKWLDVRALVESVIRRRSEWSDWSVDRIIFCTARIDARMNPNGHAEQDVYLKALLEAESVDFIEHGKYVTGVRPRPLAIRGPRPGSPPVLVRSGWPVTVQSSLGVSQPDALFMVSTLHQEEKGSDVNVATHLTEDVCVGAIDAAVVVSNDSDLRLPVQRARTRVPVGLINPRGGRFAGDLAGRPGDGVGRHWWEGLSADDFLNHQLAPVVGRYRRPDAW